MRNLSSVPEKWRTAIRNNGGGFVNHIFYFVTMRNKVYNGPQDRLAEQVNSTFGSYEEFMKEFGHLAGELFGSGYVWLVEDGKRKISIVSTANQVSVCVCFLRYMISSQKQIRIVEDLPLFCCVCYERYKVKLVKWKCFTLSVVQCVCPHRTAPYPTGSTLCWSWTYGNTPTTSNTRTREPTTSPSGGACPTGPPWGGYRNGGGR